MMPETSAAAAESSLPFYGPFFLSPEGLRAGRDLEDLPPGQARALEVRTTGGGAWLLLESILPPIHLVIVGAERDAPPLARIGRELGWAVTVVDLHATDGAAARFDAAARYVGCAPRAIAARVELSPRTAVVLATHRYLDDLAVLEALLAAPVGHLALLGPARRRERLLADLDRRLPGAGAALGERLRGPAGLDLGGRAPEEVALAVVAEIQAALSGRDARPLSARQGQAVAPVAIGP
jgi:xanthine/CO dehydrogenase XdhC/CoxF family maturation factor